MSETQISPHLDPLGLECLKDMLMNSINYLEYGSGGSTILANEFNLRSIISVDSDKIWSDKVDSLIEKSGRVVSISYCDIGPIKKWGIPLDSSGYKNYWKYITSPWKIASENNVNPNVVLIDGRFRVACFLYSLLKSKENTTILFDDYVDRPEYHIVENFCKLEKLHGRMAKFQKKAASQENVLEILLEYSVRHE